MARVTVHEETESPHGWKFRVSLAGAGVAAKGAGNGGSAVFECSLHLSWHDYEHWSHGTTPPARVAEVVLDSAMELDPELAVPPKLDAATLRRRVPGLDEAVRERL